MGTGEASLTKMSLSVAAATAHGERWAVLRLMLGTWCSTGLALPRASGKVAGPNMGESVLGFVEFILQAFGGCVIATVVHI